MANFRIVPTVLEGFTDDSSQVFELQNEIWTIDIFGFKMFPTWVTIKSSFYRESLEKFKKHLEAK